MCEQLYVYLCKSVCMQNEIKREKIIQKLVAKLRLISINIIILLMMIETFVAIDIALNRVCMCVCVCM